MRNNKNKKYSISLKIVDLFEYSNIIIILSNATHFTDNNKRHLKMFVCLNQRDLLSSRITHD